jgi:hypothetical protein
MIKGEEENMPCIAPHLGKQETNLLSSTALLVSIRSVLQANWQKLLFGSQCKSNELATKLE